MKRNNILLAIVALIILIPIIYFTVFDKDEPKTNNIPVVNNTIATLTATTIKEHAHNEAAFCEGFEFYNGVLYEGTGHNNNVNKTYISTRDIASGKEEIKVSGQTVWGEGITILKDTLYQLTYTEGKAYAYDVKTFKRIKEFSFKPDGWGMTNDGTSLIVSNGSSILTYYNPKTFAVEKTIQVTNTIGLVDGINELEFVNGFIYANIHMTNSIIKIDAKTGQVVGILDATPIATKVQAGNQEKLMNGIAFNKQTNSFFVTGKNWGKIVEIAIQ